MNHRVGPEGFFVWNKVLLKRKRPALAKPPQNSQCEFKVLFGVWSL